MTRIFVIEHGAIAVENNLLDKLHHGRQIIHCVEAEMHYAAGKLRAIASLHNLPLVLMGHSEGAIAVATIKELPSASRIIEGWTCHAGWPEYRGLAAPAGQPVLALVGADDPWFRAQVLKGDCGVYMHGPTQRSIVFRAPNYLAHKHWLSSDPDVRATIVGFVREITE